MAHHKLDISPAQAAAIMKNGVECEDIGRRKFIMVVGLTQPYEGTLYRNRTAIHEPSAGHGPEGKFTGYTMSAPYTLPPTLAKNTNGLDADILRQADSRLVTVKDHAAALYKEDGSLGPHVVAAYFNKEKIQQIVRATRQGKA